MSRNSKSVRAVKVQGELLDGIDAMGAELREALVPVLQRVAGQQPRPTQLTRSLGLDKSLASRLVRATNARTDLELMHLVPSPAGLRILADSAASLVGKASLTRLRSAAQRLQALIDAAPGGRAAIDARISESSEVARDARERTTRQSAFKSMSYLIGYYSDLLVTSLFVVPSERGDGADGLEINRRFGLRRLRRSTPVPIMGFTPWPDSEQQIDHSRFDSIEGSEEPPTPAELLIRKYCSQPMPRIEVVRTPSATTMVLPADSPAQEIPRLTWAYRIRNNAPLDPGPGVYPIGGYMLLVPCRRTVRDLFIAEDLFAGATPQVTFVLPEPHAHLRPPSQPGPMRFGEVHVSGSLEPLPRSERAHSIPGVGDHGAVTREVLERAGHGSTRFRGWRCEMVYPVPLVQTMLWLWLPHATSYEKW